MRLDLKNISESEVDTAYNFLADTDAEYAQLFAAKETLRERIKIAKARAFLLSGADSVSERNAEADCSSEVESYVDDWQNAVADWKLLDSRRQRAHTVIELWRTQEASRRRT